MNRQETYWSGRDGAAYHRRNRVDWRKRIPFWKDILDLTGARSVYEWGCGPGWNLSAIRAASDWYVECTGWDVNTQARMESRWCGFEMEVGGYGELAFTSGVLIHIPPDELRDQMRRIIESSFDWVLAIEYESTRESMIEYRGEPDLLWARPYGKIYEELGLKQVMTGGAGEGFDRCTAWLMRK